MDLSIIIVSWNAREYLSKCILSLAGSLANGSSEIIVVDNASTDGSPEMVCDQFPQVKLIRNTENLGFAKANNIGIRQCTGNYIALINSDVEVLNGCVDRLIEYMKQNSDIGMLGPQILDENRNVQRSCMGFPSVWNTFCRAFALDVLFPNIKLFSSYMMSYWSHNTIRNVDVINGCFWLIRRQATDKVGLLDERYFIYAEDKDWCKRFWDSHWKIVYYPEAKAIHYGGASSSNAPIKFYIELCRANLQYWRKHHRKAAQFAFILLTGIHHIIRLLGHVLLYIVKPAKRSQILIKIKTNLACLKWLCSLNHNIDKGVSYDK
jgi:GT2 family glycosyltransferase